MKLLIAVAAAALALTVTAPSSAQTLESTQAKPLYSPSPAVMGEVVSMNSHSVTVRTAQDEEMVFEFDSRTMMPMTLPTGQRVKVEFHLMDNGMHHAGRITRLEPGSLDWEALDRQLSYAQQERDRLEAEREAAEAESRLSASNESQRPVVEPTATTDDGNRTDVDRTYAEDNSDADRGVAGAEDTLPQTASPQPLLLVVGAAATSLALGLGLGLRRRKV